MQANSEVISKLNNLFWFFLRRRTIAVGDLELQQAQNAINTISDVRSEIIKLELHIKHQSEHIAQLEERLNAK